MGKGNFMASHSNDNHCGTAEQGCCCLAEESFLGTLRMSVSLMRDHGEGF